ncbi:MAG: LysM domain-containing protein, partial [Ilumatobacteraceae bacterium]|nr:LysM domain-containing protein [Ilumatobacteraceae bacterium]
MTHQNNNFWADADRNPRGNPRLSRPTHPLARRLGVVAVAVALCIPVARALGDNSPAPVPGGAGAVAVLEPGREPELTTTVASLPVAEVPAPQVIEAKVVVQPEVKTPQCGAKFKVQLGDSWSLLADYAGVGTRELLQVNKANARTVIVPGDELCVPSGARMRRPAPVATTQPARRASSPKPVVVVAAKRFTAAQSTRIIRDVFPDALEKRALEIVQRESRINAAAYNFCCYGLFQIHFQA